MVRFEVLKVVKMLKLVTWVVISHGLTEIPMVLTSKYASALKMEAIRSSETLVFTYRPTQPRRLKCTPLSPLECHPRCFWLKFFYVFLVSPRVHLPVPVFTALFRSKLSVKNVLGSINPLRPVVTIHTTCFNGQ
jgi:hypothetical protein